MSQADAAVKIQTLYRGHYERRVSRPSHPIVFSNWERPLRSFYRRLSWEPANCDARRRHYTPSFFFMSDFFRLLLATRVDESWWLTARCGFVQVPRSERKFVIAGGPASGKSYQGAKLAERFGVVHVSTGELLRAEAPCQHLPNPT